MDDLEHAALALIHSGAFTVTEAADSFGIPQQTLHRWCKLAHIDPKRQRANFLRKRASIALHKQWKLPRSYTQPIDARQRGRKPRNIKEPSE